MPTHKLGQKINRPVADVFATVADVTTFPSWNPTTESATKLTEGDPGLGTKFEMSIKGFGKQEIELTEFEQDTHVRLTPQSNMFEGGHTFTFTAEGDGTRVEHVLVMNPKGIFILMTPLIGFMSKRNLSRTADALQVYLEGQTGEA